MAQAEVVPGMTRLLCVAALAFLSCFAHADELRFEIPTLPGFQRHVVLLEHPGYVGVVLENNDLPPTLSSKIVIRDRGREAQAKSGIVRFTGRNGSVYNYEGGVSLGIGKASITVPASVDVSQIASGKTIVIATLPLADLLSDEKRARIESKVRALANAAVQQKLLDYLDTTAKRVGPEPGALFEAILVDAYNRSGGAMARGDVGDAVPISEQWMLIVTLAIWLIVVPLALLAYKLRRRWAKPAAR